MEDVACGLANIASDATAAEFSTQAIFAITPPASARTFKVRSLKPVIDNVARTGTAVAINNVGSTGADKCVITVSDGGNLPATCYVSLLPGVRLSDLSFDASFAETDKGAAKGIPSSQSGATASVAAGALYSIDGDNWHDYIIVGGKKWATMNIGATALTGENSWGQYFAWGEVVGHKWTAEHGFTNFPEENPDPGRYTGEWDAYSGFASFLCNTPYIEPNVDIWNPNFLKYDSDGETTLQFMDDAAFYNWGGSWRMPTPQEFTELIQNTGTSVTENFVKDNRYLVIKGTGLIFPHTGKGYMTGSGGYSPPDESPIKYAYWSNTLSSYCSSSFCLLINLSNKSISTDCEEERFYGCPIRAIAD